MTKRCSLIVQGIVQGVGFRPYVYSLATSLCLTGWVKNTSAGVVIQVQGADCSVDSFCQHLPGKLPPMAHIEQINVSVIPTIQEAVFVILPSEQGVMSTLVAPDMATCADCLADITNPANRRFGYAFTNCTNCGPRFTIIKGMPYDRRSTTMATFPLCKECGAEFVNPQNRRFHAQPNACSCCGPALSLLNNQGAIIKGDSLALAVELLSQGSILAVKGLGGYHLVCDATNESAVQKLRSKKYRWQKPFAVMMNNLDTVKKYAICSQKEAQLLLSSSAPIVLLMKNHHAHLAAAVAPGNQRVGIVLPYTPLHHLLMQHFPALVMTSGNVSEEPITFQDEQVVPQLGNIADYILSHNRQIMRPCDDSVTVVVDEQPLLIRRSRGYAPAPVKIRGVMPNILGCGAEQKVVFALTKANSCFLSQHIGDLENLATWNFYRQEVEDLERLFDIQPSIIAYDLHPQYLSTQYALSLKGQKIAVQHHHAHFAGVLAEHAYVGQAIGVIFDGTGYGTDGNLWGGEFFLGDAKAYRRLAHLAYVPLLGGEKAVKEPYRVGLAYLFAVYGEKAFAVLKQIDFQAENAELLFQAFERKINAPLSSGCGRLFDGVAAILNIGRTVDYQGQAAIELEQMIDADVTAAYEFHKDNRLITWDSVFMQIVADLQEGKSKGYIAAAFHNGLSQMVVATCLEIAAASGCWTVALSGGVWQNLYLFNKTQADLTAAGFSVLINHQVPMNDGGLAYGQVAVANAQIKEG